MERTATRRELDKDVAHCCRRRRCAVGVVELVVKSGDEDDEESIARCVFHKLFVAFFFVMAEAVATRRVTDRNIFLFAIERESVVKVVVLAGCSDIDSCQLMGFFMGDPGRSCEQMESGGTIVLGTFAVQLQLVTTGVRTSLFFFRSPLLPEAVTTSFPLCPLFFFFFLPL